MEQAAAVLAAAQSAGAVLLLEGNPPTVRDSARLPAAVLTDIDVHRRTIAVLFKGDHCRSCGRPIDWHRDGVAFADRTAAHVTCYEHAETVRQAARAHPFGRTR